MITAHPKVRIQYLRDSQAVYTANGAEGLRYATSGSVGLDLPALKKTKPPFRRAGVWPSLPASPSNRLRRASPGSSTHAAGSEPCRA